MNAKHTPGPWRHAAMRFGDIVSDRYLVARIGTLSPHAGHPATDARRAADAALIAAAPDLLAACEAIVKWMDDSGLSATKPGGVPPLAYEGTEYSVVTDARTAIAKAKGGQ